MRIRVLSRMWCFFLSSRRRHTRLTCDWSSDVCSSDLFAGCGLGELRILKDAAQDQVVAGELGERCDETARGFLVDEVSEEDRERASRGLRAEKFERRAVVRLGRGHLEAPKALGE